MYIKKIITLFRSSLLRYITASIAIAGLVSSGAVSASESAGFWATPTIQGYGKSHYFPNGKYKLQANQTYKVVFAVTKGVKSPSDVNPALNHVARAINLYVDSGVPLNHLKFVAVVYADATSLVLNNTQYKAAFGVPNPNLALIEELRAAGVDVTVCSQAVSEYNYKYEWVDKNVTLSLSGLTTITTLEHKGYSLMQL